MHFCKIDAAFAAESLSIAGVQTLFFLFDLNFPHQKNYEALKTQ